MRHLGLEKITCIVVAALVVGAGLWFAIALHEINQFPTQVLGHPSASYAIQTPIADISLHSAVWAPPQAQPRGDGWVYDVFTSPEIFYDKHTQQFRVASAPQIQPRQETDGSGFGLRVIAIEPRPFPLQLIGYVGEAGNYFGTFENRTTFETQLLKSGDHVPALRLTVERVEVRSTPITIPDSMTVKEHQVTAVVTSEETGLRTTLRQGTISLTNQVSAYVILQDDSDRSRLVGEGEVVTRKDGARFIINKIRLAPPSVEVIKESVISGSNTREAQIICPEGGTHTP